VTEIAEIQDYMIYRVIRDHGGRITKKQIFEALGTDEKTKEVIEEKLRKMTSFRIVVVEGDNVRIP
jgi:uncharacterized protein YutE (UPF0331/DUF86 family)